MSSTTPAAPVTGLGDALRASVRNYAEGSPLRSNVHRFATQADDLEHDRDRWKASAVFARDLVDKASTVLDDIDLAAGEFPDERRYNLTLDLVERLRAALSGRPAPERNP